MTIKIIWADQEHMLAWKAYLNYLENHCGFDIQRLHSTNHATVLRYCRGKEILVIHCGTIEPMANLRGLLHEIKSRYPRIKIGLLTNCTHPDVEDLVDFYVNDPISLDELEEVLRESLK